MTSFCSHEKKERMERNKQGKGGARKRERKKQNNVTSPGQSSRINDEKKQKDNSKQKSRG